MWWQILWGAAGIVLGCVTLLVIVAIRLSASVAIRTWRTDAPERERAGRS